MAAIIGGLLILYGISWFVLPRWRRRLGLALLVAALLAPTALVDVVVDRAQRRAAAAARRAAELPTAVLQSVVDDVMKSIEDRATTTTSTQP
ncbi:MAG TPA: hypothetical protein VM345_01050 [Acidimicrobiales bacterium]|jgi:CHASE1-domain containing sensor protein|nr:hypothetical protein [Acidimicrobiales bacterium]